eukprot:ANDGO_07310.mRNA.1 Protein zntD
MDIELLKVLLALVIFAVGLAGAMVPILHQRWNRYSKQQETLPTAEDLDKLESGMSFIDQEPVKDRVSKSLFEDGGEAIGAGVILSAGLVHVLPQAASMLAEIAFPLAYAVSGSVCLALFSLKCWLEDGNHTSGALTLLFGLSFHSFLEGLGLGTESSSHEIIMLFAAVIAHKGFAAYSLGVRLTRLQWPAIWLVAAAVAFSLACPVGIAVGSLATGGGHSSSVANGILLSCAGGSFIFVSFLEMLPEVALRGRFFWKQGWLCLGFGGFTVLALWV